MKSKSTDDEPPPERTAGFVLYAEDEGERHYLLLRHRNGTYWGFPKGHIENGETEVRAGLREVREETGIEDIEIIPGFREVSSFWFSRDGRPTQKVVVHFLGRCSQEPVTLTREHLGARWVSYGEASDLLTFEDARKILAQADEFLRTQRQELKQGVPHGRQRGVLH
jgi:bis(5'-nucleosidyl)-tetraphosphatase